MLIFSLLPLMLLCQRDLTGQDYWSRGAVLPRRSCGDSLVEIAWDLLAAVPESGGEQRAGEQQ